MSLEVIRNLGWDLISGSAKAALLGILVLAVRAGLRRHLSPAWRLILWGVVLVRLIWPWEIPTPVSLFNVMVPWLPSITASSFPLDGWRWAAVVWGVGLLLGFARLLVECRRIRAKIHRAAPVDPGLVALWNEVIEGGPAFLSGVRLRSSPEVFTPCVAGLFRPCLLVPSDLGGRFSGEEIRLMFLHEMAHLRRRDLWVDMALESIRILHWFNPVVGWVLRRWREDREEMCDVHALSSDRVSNFAYGRVLLKCLESGATSTTGIPVETTQTMIAAGWMGAASAAPRSLVHRMEAIVRFRTGRRTWIVGACTLLAVGLLGLTEQRPLPPRRVWMLETHLARSPLAPSALSGILPARRTAPQI